MVVNNSLKTEMKICNQLYKKQTLPANRINKKSANKQQWDVILCNSTEPLVPYNDYTFDK